MLKLTRIAAVLLIGLAVILAVVAFGISRRAAPAAPAIPSSSGTGADAPAQPTTTPVVEAAMTQGVASQLNPGERALAVPVDELVAAGNRIQPGDFVDVFLNLRASGGLRNDGDAQTRLLLSRLRVLSYGAHDVQPHADTAAGGQSMATDSRAQDITGGGSTSGSRSDGANVPARSAVLAVPVAEANRLLLGAQQGKLFLALRNPDDIGLPDQALFPAPNRVLTPRGTLSAEERLALQRPENDAYAGLDTDALAGRGRSAAAVVPLPTGTPPRAAPRHDRGIEIIRGDISSHSGSR